METLAPTREWIAKGDYEPPQLNQRYVRPTWRRKSAFERIKTLEPEHRQAIARLERHYYGAQGIDVRMDDESHGDRDDVPDEFAIHRHAGLLENAKKEVRSPRVWKALICQIESTLTPQDIGQQWAGIKSRDGAKKWAERLIVGGLDALALHWGFINRNPP